MSVTHKQLRAKAAEAETGSVPYASNFFLLAADRIEALEAQVKQARLDALWEARTLAKQHRAPNKPISNFASDEQRQEIYAEQRGEQIASEIIGKAIQALIDATEKETPPNAEQGDG